MKDVATIGTRHCYHGHQCLLPRAHDVATIWTSEFATTGTRHCYHWHIGLLAWSSGLSTMALILCYKRLQRCYDSDVASGSLTLVVADGGATPSCISHAKTGSLAMLLTRFYSGHRDGSPATHAVEVLRRRTRRRFSGYCNGSQKSIASTGLMEREQLGSCAMSGRNRCGE
jgi:hypothetical protein